MRGRPVTVILFLSAVVLNYRAPGFTLEILHINDTHSNLLASPLGIVPADGGEEISIMAGSAARASSMVGAARESGGDLLFLHAGDLVQGTLFYTVYGGAADADVYNLMRPDAMVPGNHEFDRGSEGLSYLLEQVRFPVVCANLDLSGDSLLSGMIPSCTVIERSGERIAVIGLITEELPEISSPSPETLVLPVAETAQRKIDSLVTLGIDKVILLTHIGYDNDLQLASRLRGADLIVGGHSHTLLGDFAPLGLDPAGDYPTVVSDLNGDTVLVVQAWRYGQVLGRLTVEFDDTGRVTSWSGSPVILTGGPFVTGSGDSLSSERLEEVLSGLTSDTLVAMPPEDRLVAGTVEAYLEAIEEMQSESVAVAAVDLPHVRVPGEDLPEGSLIAPIVCDALLWKVREVGTGADIALQNAGGVRIDFPRGTVTLGDVYRLLPFGNTLAVLDLTGDEVRRMIENALSDIFDRGCSDGAFPYVSGMSYRASMNAPEGTRISWIGVSGSDGVYTEMDPGTTYRLVTNAFVAGGGDGYTMLKGRPFTDTGFTDSEVFLEYIRSLGTVEPVPQRVFLQLD